MLVTKEEIKMTIYNEDIVIPKGTKTTHQTALGLDENYNFISDYNWYKPHLKGYARTMALHDFFYRGINIPRDKLVVVAEI